MIEQIIANTNMVSDEVSDGFGKVVQSGLPIQKQKGADDHVRALLHNQLLNYHHIIGAAAENFGRIHFLGFGRWSHEPAG